MLDTATKKRIDDCRDILVGKLPDPKAQIEQITIGLIYKFMDDMDKEAIELGGKAKFFSGAYAPYAWDELMDSKVGAQQMLERYSKAIESMEKNPNIPSLFRDIFNNAYLPYRDPETLKLFLKTIDHFTYTHSEKLGDAFEYLLSVMGSQGDAGQFRTPRHIIDFLVALVDPGKQDTILDPACGTAGFLISAFKHIKGKGKLTPSEQNTLIRNVMGYDISPDMVRLSLVNLYLHGFSEPHIYEYDTLTSEERWKEKFDVILANPPFMSPKGGIRPHKKFTINSKRSEVLFVDYIAEHLNPKGRAGIIVPEGIIFQSGKAYKELRKQLVQHSLYAVVSLPAGVFNPYSGVKTSILLLDKVQAKKQKEVLFIKIENDGYSLGAQRNPIKGSQLKEAISCLQKFQKGEWQEEEVPKDSIAHAVHRERIAENGEYNLSGDRYKRINSIIGSNFKRLGDICEFKRGPFGGSLKKEIFVEQGIAVYEQNHAIYNQFEKFRYFISDNKFEEMRGFEVKPNDLIMSCSGTMGKVAIVPKYAPKGIINQALLKLSASEKILPVYLKLLMESDLFQVALNNTVMGVAIKNVASVKVLKELQIPLPPLAIQEEIVAEIEGYQKIIDGAKAVVDNYKPRIDIDPDWEMMELGEVCEVNPKKSEVKELNPNLEVSFVPMAVLNENQIDFAPSQTRPLSEVYKGYTYFKEDDVLLAKVTPCFENGKAGIAQGLKNRIGFGSSEFFVLRPNNKILPTWIYLNIITNTFRKGGKLSMTGTGGLQRVPPAYVKSTLIPLPDVEIQHQIIARIEKEQELVNANKALIEIFEQRIKDRMAKVWGEE